MNKWSKLLIIIFLLVFVFSFAEGKKKVYKVPSIIIKSKKWANVIIINSKTIEQSHATSIKEVLEMVPGITTVEGSKGNTTLFIRGLSSSKIKILINGIPINDAYYNTIDLDMIPINFIKKIEIYKGLNSSKFGVNALGGVINIITKNNVNKLNISGEYNNFNGGQLNGSASLNFGDLIFDIFVNDIYTDGFKLSKSYKPQINENGGIRENSAKEKMNTMIKGTYYFSNNSYISLNIMHIDNKKELPYSTIATKNMNKPFSIYKEPRYWRFTKWIENNYNISGYIQLLWNNYIKFFANHLKIYNVLDMYKTEKFYDIGEEDTFDDYRDNLNISFEGEHFLKYKIGILNENKHHFKTEENYIFNSKKIKTIDSTTKNLYAILERDFSNFSFNINLSNSHFDTNVYQKDNWNYTLKAEYTLNHFNINYLYGKNYHYPELNQLMDAISPDLQPEYSKEFDLFIGFKSKIFSGKLGYYENYVENLINRDGKYMPYYNINKTFTHGVEFNYTLRPFNLILIKGSADYINAINVSKLGTPGDYVKEIPYIPIYKVFTAVEIKPFRNILVHSDFTFFGKSYNYVDYNKVEISPYFLMNVGVIYKFKNFALYMKINNIFDKNYYLEVGYPLAGREILYGLKVNLE